MAKMFYTMEETKTALGKNEEEIKQFAREGRLREFRDGPRLMFKADQVEQLKSELGSAGGDALSLAPADDAPLSLAGDSTAGELPGKKEDTHFAADIGLSGSLSGKAASTAGSPAIGSSSGSGIGTGSGANRGGITIFDVDESQRVDPSAQTAINPSLQAQQVNMESVGSGSGLLDLTRESDDTSLGAVFDELTPGARRPSAAPSNVAALETQAGTDIGMPAIDRAARATLAAPIYVEQADAVTSALGAAAVAASAILCFGGFVLISAIMGWRPAIMDSLQLNDSGKLYFLLAAGITLIVGVAGFFIGKMGKKPA